MTNDQSKTVIHLAIEHKRFAFVDHLFDWLPPGDDGGGKEQPHSGRAGGGGKDGGGHKESAGATSKHVELARRTAHMAAGAWQHGAHQCCPAGCAVSYSSHRQWRTRQLLGC